MTFVERILPVARERLVAIKDDALLNGGCQVSRRRTHQSCRSLQKGGAMVGIVTRTDVVHQMSICQGVGCAALVGGGDDQGCYVLPLAMYRGRHSSYDVRG